MNINKRYSKLKVRCFKNHHKTIYSTLGASWSRDKIYNYL